MLAQTAAHFAHEERLMVAFDYSLLDRHQRSHELFLEDAGCYLQELQANGLTLVFRRWAVGRLLEWFRLHVLAHDVALGHFLQNARAAEPPARAQARAR